MICVQVELSLAYQCNVSQESLLKYIHFNRHHNTLLIEHTVKMVKENRRLIDDNAMRKSATGGRNCCDKTSRPGAGGQHSDWKGTGWYRVTGVELESS